jgi:hypothetical protein
LFHLPDKRTAKSFFVTLVVVFSSCGFIDLRPVEIKISPDKPGALLPGAYSPLSVWFNTSMIKKEAESLLRVSSDTGMVEGDLSWSGTTMQFMPAAGWTPGTRYELNLSGMARTGDGRELRIDRAVSFFAINRSLPPLVERFIPADGESVGVNPGMELYFSQAMDRLSVESALSIEGMADKKFEWSIDGKILSIMPERNFSSCTVYRWSLKTTAKSLDGVPLAQAFSASFSTDLDRVLPKVIDVYPVLESNGHWIPTGGSLEEDLGLGLGIALEFNKPMSEAAFRSLRFEPSLSGRTEKISDRKMVFIPGRDPEPETVYTLIVPGDTKDASGLKIGDDYRRSFIAGIPYLRVISVNIVNGGSVNPEEQTLTQIPVSDVDGGLVRFTICFSLLFDDEAKQKASLAVKLTPFFPGTLDPTALRFVSWFSDDRLTMEWERVKKSTPDEPHFYKLQIPGGRSGICSSDGIYLKEDIVLYMEALE